MDVHTTTTTLLGGLADGVCSLRWAVNTTGLGEDLAARAKVHSVERQLIRTFAFMIRSSEHDIYMENCNIQNPEQNTHVKHQNMKKKHQYRNLRTEATH